MYFLIGSLLGACVVIYILLMGQSAYHKDGYVGKVNKFLTDALPKAIKKGLRRVLGERISGCLFSSCFYIIGKRNPIFMTLYVLLVVGGYVVYLMTTFEDVPPFHQTMGFFALYITVLLFSACCFSDPGEITGGTWHYYSSNYKIDGVLYQAQVCRTCLLWRPARSKHCSLCNKCVARYDHHCPWINSCVGAQNTRYFILMLYSTALYTSYGAYLTFDSMLRFIEQHHLFQRRIYDHSIDSFRTLTVPEVLPYIAHYRSLQSTLFLFCALISLVLFCFAGYQFYLAAKNMTTNETFKYENLKYALRYYKDKMKLKEKGELSEEDKEKLLDEETAGHYQKALDTTYYNIGFFQNLKEVFFPKSDYLPPRVVAKEKEVKQKKK